MDKIKTVKIKNEDGSISEESYTISVDAKDVDMDNGKDLQDTIGTIDIDTDGNIAEQLENLNDNVDDLNKDIKKKAYFFDTIADMKNANLKDGDYACTLGYYNANDGGAAEYKIVDSTENYKETLNNNLFAELIIKDEANVKKFGAYGDDSHDDTIYFERALLASNDILIPNGTYLINLSITKSDIKMTGSGLNCMLKNFNNNEVILVNGKNNTFKDFSITCTSESAGCIFISASHNNFENIKFDKSKNYAVKFINNNSVVANTFISCYFYRCKNGILIPANDENGFANASMFNSCYFDRYWDGITPCPIIETGTSVLIANSWFQAKNRSGIKITNSLAPTRVIGCRMDSSSGNDILVEITGTATPSCFICDGTDVDGKIDNNGVETTFKALYRTRQIIKTLTITGTTNSNGYLDSNSSSQNLPVESYEIIGAECIGANYDVFISRGGSTNNRYAFRLMSGTEGTPVSSKTVEIKVYYLSTETY